MAKQERGLRFQPAGGTKAPQVPVGKKQRLSIERLANDGRGIAFVEGRTWFVSGALAGEEVEAEEPFDLGKAVSDAFATIPTNLVDAMSKWGDPVGLEVGDVSDLEATAESQEVSTDTFSAMASRFDGAAGAFAYLLFILLYFPCTAAIAAVYQESGIRWTIFVAGWTTGLAYGAATIYYQVATYASHPASSMGW